MKKKNLLAIACFVLFALNLNAANYYVAINGLDTNSGSIEFPWKTLNTAISKMNPGDILFVRGGTYIQRLVTGKSGTTSQPLVITAYPGELPILDGDSTLAANWGSMVNLTGSYVHLKGFEIRRGLGVGVYLGGSYNKMSNCNIHHHAERGVHVGGNNNIVEYCEVWFNAWYNCRLPGWPASKYPNGGWGTGLSAMRYPTGVILRHNFVHDNWGEGLSSFEAMNTTIEDNIVYNNYNVNMYISDIQNTVAQRNIIYNTPEMLPYLRGGTGIGICDEIGVLLDKNDHSNRSANNKIINNLVFGCNSNLSWWADSRTPNPGMNNILIAHNTFVNGVTKCLAIKTDNRLHTNIRFMNNLILQEDSKPIAEFSSVASITFSNNLWSKAPPTAMSSTSDVTNVNPLLAKTGSTAAGELTADYFKITSGSPAIGRGLSLVEVPEDYFKVSRIATPDIGGHEFDNTTNSKKSIRDNKAFIGNVYPNPTNAVLYIDNVHEVSLIRLLNIRGMIIQTWSNTSQIDICNKPSGLYFLQLKNVDGNLITYKIFKL